MNANLIVSLLLAMLLPQAEPAVSPVPRAEAWRTSSTASRTVMK